MRTEDGFVRHSKSRAILNTDNKSYEKYKQTRMASYKLNEVSEEVQSLKSDMQDMKVMLSEILSNFNRK